MDLWRAESKRRGTTLSRAADSSDVSDDEWALVAPLPDAATAVRRAFPGAERGFILLPRRWVVERSFAWATRFRRPVKDYERYPSTLADLHIVAFFCLMLEQAAKLAHGS